MKLGRGFSVVFADGADDSYSVFGFAGRRPSFSRQRGGGGGGNPRTACNALAEFHPQVGSGRSGNPTRLVTGLYIGGSGK